MRKWSRRRIEKSEEERKRDLGITEEEERALRSCINSRERKRMHDLNDALEDLRSVLPYFKDTSNRRMSKISTLILATNWIRHLNKANASLKQKVDDLTTNSTEIKTESE
ncbi:hypothetical protein PFISCL1PPCAC_12181, partial [Pristionchus fissidentatus]